MLKGNFVFSLYNVSSFNKKWKNIYGIHEEKKKKYFWFNTNDQQKNALKKKFLSILITV